MEDNIVVLGLVDQLVYCPYGDCRHKEMFSNTGDFDIKCYGCDKYFKVEVREPVQSKIPSDEI